MRDARRLDFALLTGIDSLTYKLRSFDDGRRVLVILILLRKSKLIPSKIEHYQRIRKPPLTGFYS
jgi:hypothetical protein